MAKKHLIIVGSLGLQAPSWQQCCSLRSNGKAKGLTDWRLSLKGKKHIISLLSHTHYNYFLQFHKLCYSGKQQADRNAVCMADWAFFMYKLSRYILYAQYGSSLQRFSWKLWGPESQPLKYGHKIMHGCVWQKPYQEQCLIHSLYSVACTASFTGMPWLAWHEWVYTVSK